jgi:hypothetical protein
MNIRRPAVTVAILATAFGTVWSQTPAENRPPEDRPRIPVYITPFYVAEDLQISVGPISGELAAADANSILPLVDGLRKDRNKLRAEVMYVVAIRLYDLGHKDEAVRWFHSARYRGQLFSSILDKDQVGGVGDAAFELKQAYSAFHQLAGIYINGYAFGDLNKLENTLKKVIEEGNSMPDFAALYPEVAFVDSEKWTTKNDVVAGGVVKIIDYIRTNADTIKAQRRLNGIDGKY